jgi:hypothetical protein
VCDQLPVPAQLEQYAKKYRHADMGHVRTTFPALFTSYRSDLPANQSLQKLSYFTIFPSKNAVNHYPSLPGITSVLHCPAHCPRLVFIRQKHAF